MARLSAFLLSEQSCPFCPIFPIILRVRQTRDKQDTRGR
nr:MAG TPA: zinc finger domain protein [Caudoviricetes sp.]